jgi:transcriptional regulator with XRE-family HTH domain
MDARAERFTDIDQNIAAGVRAYREAASVSQEELAQRMSDRGFGFSQATVWKIERGQRPVKASELLALADALGALSPMDLTSEPGIARHAAQLHQAHRNAYEAYQALKKAAAVYIEAQFDLVYAARAARDDGLTVTELYTSWLRVPPEEAVIQARVETNQEDAQAEHVSDEVGKVLAALRSAGYEPTLRIEDLKIEGHEVTTPTPVREEKPLTSLADVIGDDSELAGLLAELECDAEEEAAARALWEAGRGPIPGLRKLIEQNIRAKRQQAQAAEADRRAAG